MPHSSSVPIPIEAKVTAATTASAVVAFLLDGLTNVIQNSDKGLLLTALPDWLEPFLTAFAVGLPTFAAGYKVRHTHRPDLRNDPVPGPL